MVGIICDGTMIDDIIDEFSIPIICRVVSKSFVDEYGDASESYKDYSINVVVQSWSADTQEVKEGMFHAGALTLTFRQDDQFLAVEGNKVKYLDVWYKINRVIKQPIAGTLYYVYCLLKKG